MALPPSAEQPVFLVIAGPNGSGKSSVYQDTGIEMGGRSMWIVNPDLLTLRIQTAEKMGLRDANLAAVQRIEAWLDASIDVHKSVGVETVLSTAKYRRLVEKAQGLGFAFWFIYVVLESPELNVERVKLRVLKGGHDVAEADIRKRYVRSLAQFPWFLEQADRAWIYDNSGASPRKVGEKRGGTVAIDPHAPKAVTRALGLTK